MGMDATAKICYGILVDEYELPWNVEKYDNYIEDWWVEGVLGFDKDFYDYWDEENKQRIEPQYTEEYLEPKRKLKIENPLPIEVEYFGHANGHQETMIIVKGTLQYVYWGPEEFEFPEPQLEEVGDFKDFCLEYIPDQYQKPKWYLGAYYG